MIRYFKREAIAGMGNYWKIREVVKKTLENGKKYVVFPYGENGMLTVQILRECFGIKDIVIVDNELCKYNSEIKKIDFLRNIDDKKEYQVLFASYNKSLLVELTKVVSEGKVIQLFEDTEGTSEGRKGHTRIGRYCYGPLVKDNFKIASIGSFCCFAKGVDVVWNHPLDMVTNHEFMYSPYHCNKVDNQKIAYSELNKKFIIGNDVWLGQNVLLTNGVKIGNGVRAAAGAVITKDIPDYAVVAGVPAKIIKYRFTEEQIQQLNKIAWWNWNIEKIKECYDDFMDIEIFLKKHGVD